MSRDTTPIRCSLCFEKDEPDGGNLIWYDSLQLCKKCYDKYTESAYNQRCMLINSIHCYRKLIGKYENQSNVIIDVKFDRIS